MPYWRNPPAFLVESFDDTSHDDHGQATATTENMTIIAEVFFE